MGKLESNNSQLQEDIQAPDENKPMIGYSPDGKPVIFREAKNVKNRIDQVMSGTRTEGVKKALGAVIAAPFNPLRAAVKGAKAGKQILTGKEVQTDSTVDIARGTAKGIRQVAIGTVTGPKRVVKGVKQILTGRDGTEA
jgi:hypothetical protein